jgi:pantoate--beta-alanine ligase
MPETDLKLIESITDVVYLPEVSDLFQENEPLLPESIIYPLNQSFEGSFRPGHYAGVITVVHKLFDAVMPDVAFFGQKDFQQVLVISKMTAQLHPTISIVTIPTKRTETGLAMSSRNLRLNEQELETASNIYVVLNNINQDWNNGNKTEEALENNGIEKLVSLGIEVEYLSIVNSQDLTKGELNMPKVLLFAGYVGGVRLIDNVML